jgi:hypothetical protein
LRQRYNSFQGEKPGDLLKKCKNIFTDRPVAVGLCVETDGTTGYTEDPLVLILDTFPSLHFYFEQELQ